MHHHRLHIQTHKHLCNFNFKNFFSKKMMMTESYQKKYTILMFPWLGHGHVSPFLELSKKLNNTNMFNIYLCSTPANLESVKKMSKTECLSSIKLIDLNLPTLTDLPPQLHTTNGLPSHLMPTLKKAFDMAESKLSKIMGFLKPDLLVYDMIQYWAPTVAAAQGIPSVCFITTSATMASMMFHLYENHSKSVRDPFPFKKIFFRAYENGNVTDILESSANGVKDKDRVDKCVRNSTKIVLVKSFKEIESKYAKYLSDKTGKKIVPVGPLVVDPMCVNMEQNSVIQWLDKKTTRSTIFVSFGSEYFLSSEDLKEIAHGLEISNVNFIWVLRFPKSEKKVNLEEALPLGFLEKVKDRGLIVEGWAPQTKILGHKNIGGFVSHCGWSSVLEAMKFGVPIIAMPMHLDQPVNARLVVEVGFGVEVLRDGNGHLKRENVASVIQQVIVNESGRVVREKAKKMSVDLKAKGDEEIEVVADELLELCKVFCKRRGGSRLQKTKSEAVGMTEMLCALKGTKV